MNTALSSGKTSYVHHQIYNTASTFVQSSPDQQTVSSECYFVYGDTQESTSKAETDRYKRSSPVMELWYKCVCYVFISVDTSPRLHSQWEIDNTAHAPYYRFQCLFSPQKATTSTLEQNTYQYPTNCHSSEIRVTRYRLNGQHQICGREIFFTITSRMALQHIHTPLQSAVWILQ